jgi:YihY family inner membrane protein
VRPILDRLSSGLRHLFAFGKHVLVEFFHNKGLLLSGAVGYNALLSMVPLLAVLIFVLTHFFERQEILEVLSHELAIFVPGHAEAIIGTLETFLDQRDIFGGIGILALLFFSSIAFRILEDALEVIFRDVETRRERSFLVSAIIPYLFIGAVGFGLLAITIVTGVLDAIAETPIHLFGQTYSLEAAAAVSLDVLAFLSGVVLISSIYIVMPVSRIHRGRALIGGAAAGLLWEIVRRVLIYYFANISLVNAVYGSLATVIIVLLTMEIAAFIILLGAQVIAELERNAQLGEPWYTARKRATSPQRDEPIHDQERGPERSAELPPEHDEAA